MYVFGMLSNIEKLAAMEQRLLRDAVDNLEAPSRPTPRRQAAHNAIAQMQGKSNTRAAPKVKQLEWKEPIDALHSRADAVYGGGYIIEHNIAPLISPIHYYARGVGQYPSLDQAKAACQADFERRVLACLEGE